MFTGRPFLLPAKHFIWTILILLLGLLSPWRTTAVGTWTSVNRLAPDNLDTMLLLSDGTVMAASGQPNAGGFGQVWYRLTPDIHGSYVNGTWSTLASMNYPRLFYSSEVLTNGQVFVAGAEYSTDIFTGPGTTNGEIYNPLANAWTLLPPTPGINGFYDSCSEMLPNGNVLVSPVTPASFGGTLIWNTASNIWSKGPRLFQGDDEDEASWAKLADNSILTIDPHTTNSERYIPALNKWIGDTNLPVTIYDSLSNEMGPELLLPDGRVLVTGGTGNTALYTPSGTTNRGIWTAWPLLPNSDVTADAPGAMLVNGKALLVMSSAIYSDDNSFYEYDPGANAYTAVPSPSANLDGFPTFGMRMLALPDGTILLSAESQQLYVYQPDGSPLAAGRPTINTLTTNLNGTYHLTGTLFNGINEGANYGDDAQMNSNYPLVRMTNGVGQVYYARTFNWNSTGVMTGANIVSTDFLPPSSVPYGIYSLVVTANGNASAPVTFVYSPDTLLVANTNGTFFTGTNGGPFSPAISFTLTNLGAATLNWSLVNTSTWLNVSSSSGTLTAGGPATTLSVSLNTATADALPFGTYGTTLLFTNLTDHVVQSQVITLAANPPQLVKNGGFETGTFNSWTQTGDNDGNEFVNNSSTYAHSGNDCAVFQPLTGLYFLSQNLSTTPGQLYEVSFWTLSYTNPVPSRFVVNWAGTNLVNLTNPPANFGWTQMQYFVTAAGSSATLQFGIQYDSVIGNLYFSLDDVSVAAVQPPRPQLLAKTNGVVNLTWNTLYGHLYQLQYTTNLVLGPWNNLDGPATASGPSTTIMDITPTDPHRFYRLILSH